MDRELFVQYLSCSTYSNNAGTKLEEKIQYVYIDTQCNFVHKHKKLKLVFEFQIP